MRNFKAKLTVEEMAEVVAEYLLEKKMDQCVEYSEKSKNFKLKLAIADQPVDIQIALRGCTKESSTIFDGKKVKARVLPANLLSQDKVTGLKALGITPTFVDCVNEMLEQRKLLNEKNGMLFLNTVRRLVWAVVFTYQPFDHEVQNPKWPQ